MKVVIRQCTKQDNDLPGMSEGNIMNMYFSLLKLNFVNYILKKRHDCDRQVNLRFIVFKILLSVLIISKAEIVNTIVIQIVLHYLSN